MRIRNIKPEFWRSQDITGLPRELRLLFVGLWSYVDDNGVGVDDFRQVTADLFALEDDQNEAREFVQAGLQRLADVSLLTRYEINGKRFVFVNTWCRHQRVHNPNKPRYPLPNGIIGHPASDYVGSTEGVGRVYVDPIFTTKRTSAGDGGPGVVSFPGDNNENSLTSNYVDPTETLGTGSGGQGVRGSEGLKDLAIAAAPAAPDLFDEFWEVYPRKVSKLPARKAWAKALKKKPSRELIDSARVWHVAWIAAGTDMEFIPHPSTWLTQERWNDALPPARLRLASGGHIPFQNPDDQSAYDEPLG